MKYNSILIQIYKLITPAIRFRYLNKYYKQTALFMKVLTEIGTFDFSAHA